MPLFNPTGGDGTASVSLTPATSARNVVSPTGPAVIALAIQAAAAQAVNLVEIKDPGGILQLAVTSAGVPTSPSLTSTGTSLLLRNTGDALGAVKLELKNRGGAAGAVFTNETIDLVDFAFVGSSAVARSLRYENRSNALRGPGPAPEFQFGPGGLAVAAISDTYVWLINQAGDPPTPTAGGCFYCKSGALYYKGTSGTVTAVAPA